jgi:hypothetical protein
MSTFTSDDLAALNAAIASGELTIKHNGREVTYRSMDELLKAKQTVEAELAAQSNGGRTGGSFHYRFTTARGD